MSRRLSLGQDRPSEFRLQTLKAGSADPEVHALLSFGVVRISITPALFVSLFPIRKAFAVITNTCGAERAMIVSPILVWTIPLFPDEGRILPESESILPAFRDFLELSQIAHEPPPGWTLPSQVYDLS